MKKLKLMINGLTQKNELVLFLEAHIEKSLLDWLFKSEWLWPTISTALISKATRTHIKLIENALGEQCLKYKQQYTEIVKTTPDISWGIEWFELQVDKAIKNVCKKIISQIKVFRKKHNKMADKDVYIYWTKWMVLSAVISGTLIGISLVNVVSALYAF